MSRVHVISRRALRDFAASHSDSEAALETWYRVAKAARWKNLVQAQQAWPTAESVEGFTVFNIKGNAYRLITRINYRSATIFIRAVMTHAQYSKGTWKK
jgi:mRNA interferase HigB